MQRPQVYRNRCNTAEEHLHDRLPNYSVAVATCHTATDADTQKAVGKIHILFTFMLSLFRAWQSREPTRAAAACSRCMRQMALVDYRSDSSTSSTSVRSTANTARRRVSSSARAGGPFDTPLSKRRKPLPSLPGTYQTGINPRDDPAQHQGRKRTRPYVEGDYIAHVSVSRQSNSAQCQS